MPKYPIDVNQGIVNALVQILHPHCIVPRRTQTRVRYRLVSVNVDHGVTHKIYKPVEWGGGKRFETCKTKRMNAVSYFMELYHALLERLYNIGYKVNTIQINKIIRNL